MAKNKSKGHDKSGRRWPRRVSFVAILAAIAAATRFSRQANSEASKPGAKAKSPAE